MVTDRPALVLVATPIGNMGDLGARALDELSNADSVAVEDSRRAGQLFAHYGIEHDPFLVCNDHTEHHAAHEIVRRVGAGQRVVLISDAGTPGVSDPGFRAVQAAIAAGHRVEAIPGPSAVLAAVTLSGFATDRFCFEGFLPRKGGERAKQLDALATELRTAVLFESPRRLGATLADLEGRCGSHRGVAVVRELTKTHEQVWRGTLGEALLWTAENEPRGEIVIVLDGATPLEVTDELITRLVQESLDGGLSRRDAVAEVVASTGAPKRRVYDLSLDL